MNVTASLVVRYFVFNGLKELCVKINDIAVLNMSSTLEA